MNVRGAAAHDDLPAPPGRQRRRALPRPVRDGLRDEWAGDTHRHHAGDGGAPGSRTDDRLASPGSPARSDAILPHLRNHVNTILLANHGPVGFDRTLDLAFFHLETIDMCCRQLLLVKQVGSIQRISEEKMQEVLAARKRMDLPDPRHTGQDPCPPAQHDE